VSGTKAGLRTRLHPATVYHWQLSGQGKGRLRKSEVGSFVTPTCPAYDIEDEDD
jgi:hypothetical protein